MNQNQEILNRFLDKMTLEKEQIIKEIRSSDLSNTDLLALDEKFLYPFRNEYLLSVPDVLVTDVYFSGICIDKGISAYLEISECLVKSNKSL
ncbi:hypothetical protein MG290_04510 [Flavobacterium sp. CBA20B-1]|uniref:hypothetical protein n=1 Tax=unclassified Flavobacterium TaxID=196869 RepID=UPI0022257498|nr:MULTISPECIES: hypothetical protein [unclassified Flavobacterium]WCM42946.1 hypothetical protein MG290_04510 [Flavobacterium sp. CBA20B-1]